MSDFLESPVTSEQTRHHLGDPEPMTCASDDEIADVLRQLAAAPRVEPAPELYPFAAGVVVGDTYRIEERVGFGGMGVVYRATDLSLGRSVALKLHRRRPEPDRLDRLMREASVMARLCHPHIVTVFEVGHHSENVRREPRLFVAMEFVEGGSAAAWAHACRPDWRAVLEVYLQAGEGLAAAHDAGIVHRDFKPENVLVDRHDRARVADFGLARPAPGVIQEETLGGSCDDIEHQTRDGAVLGTPAYMAPEQWRGEPGTAASDQYAYCVTLFEQLFDDNPLARSRATVQDDSAVRWVPPRRRGVPASILRALRRGLAHDPAARFESMHALLEALRRDPWRRPRRVGLSLILLGSGGLFAWSLAPANDRACDASEQLRGSWNPELRAGVIEGLRATELPFSDTTALRVSTLLDAHARAWVDEFEDVCDAAGRSQTDARAACLRADLHRMNALVQTFAHADATVAEHAVTAAASLPAPQQCALEPPQRSAPSNPAAREALEPHLASLSASVASGHLDEASRLEHRLRPQIVAAGDAVLTAHFELLAGRLSEARDPSDAVVVAFDRALEAALESSDDALVADASTELTTALSRTRRPREADRTLLVAEAAARRRSPPVEVEVRLFAARAGTLIGRERYEEAAEVARAGLALARTRLGEEHPMTLDMVYNLGVALRWLQAYDEVLVLYEEGIAGTRRLFGVGHPREAGFLTGRSAVEASQGRYRAGLASMREARDIYLATRGPLASATVKATVNLSSAIGANSISADESVVYEEVRALLEPLVEEIEALGREDDPDYANLWDNFGLTLTKLGDPERGIRYIQRALSAFEVAYGQDSVHLAPPLTKLASSQLELGRYDDARSSAARALQIVARHDVGMENVVRVEILSGMIEARAGNAEAARSRFEQARDHAREADLDNLRTAAEQRLASLERE